MANKTFDIEVTMDERWVDYFCSMLKYMERCGNIGHSSIVGFYSDGDGDFHPKFKFDIEFDEKNYRQQYVSELEAFFDAG